MSLIGRRSFCAAKQNRTNASRTATHGQSDTRKRRSGTRTHAPSSQAGRHERDKAHRCTITRTHTRTRTQTRAHTQVHAFTYTHGHKPETDTHPHSQPRPRTFMGRRWRQRLARHRLSSTHAIAVYCTKDTSDMRASRKVDGGGETASMRPLQVGREGELGCEGGRLRGALEFHSQNAIDGG